MPRRDYEKIAYWIIPVERDTEVYKLIMDDATETGMTNNIPMLLKLRIAEYYLRRRDNNWRDQNGADDPD